ncbi:hypothetical protein AgCh_003825 [Apium graveolens]
MKQEGKRIETLTNGQEKEMGLQQQMLQRISEKSLLALSVEIVDLEEPRTRGNIATVQDYELAHVLRKIINSLTGEELHSLNKPEEIELPRHLRRKLDVDQYFVVIDDIWDVDIWKKIKNAFPDKRNGSRVIVTTRNKTGAEGVEEFISEADEDDGVDMEDVAEDYVNEFINLNMIEIELLSLKGQVLRFRVHDLVRDLAIEKAMEHKILGIFDSRKQHQTTIRLLQGQSRHVIYNGINEYLKLLGPNFDAYKFLR